jgi:uncharacterized protein
MRRVVLWIILWASVSGCTPFFFQPMRALVVTPERLELAYEDVYFPSNDGVRLHAWFLPAKEQPLGTVFFLHGNAENISTHIGSVHWLPKQGFHVFLFDYRGYGASEGYPSLIGLQADIDSALRVLLMRPDVDPERIAIFGQSLGGALAIYYVAHSSLRSHIRALIVESAFAGYRAITREKFASFWLTWPLSRPLSWLVDDSYSPLPVVDRISPIPLLIIHGDQDRIVPAHHGKQLYDVAREPKDLWIVPDAGHINALRRENYRGWFAAYLREHFDVVPTQR